MFIAEIGINHNGDLDVAKRMIKGAKLAGADIVKFQKRNPDVCVPEHQKDKDKDTPWGTMTYLEYKHMIEFGKEEYDEIDEYCKLLDIKWTASVWDIDSLKFIMQYDVPFIKIASATITDNELLNIINVSVDHVVMSTGMSTKDEVDEAVDLLKDCKRVDILHCNSAYPPKDSELNLNVISRLIDKYDNKIGYSGHSECIHDCIVAKTLGAEIFEKHVTLDKDMWGSDQKASIDFDELTELIGILERIDVWLGSDMIRVTESELPIRKKLRR